MRRYRNKGLTLKKQQRLLLAGTEHGVGVTHLALALANASAAKERRPTLYVEVGQQGWISSLRTKDTFAEEGQAGFLLRGVAYLPRVDVADACGLLLHSRWHTVICDVTEKEAADQLFAACDRCLVLCDIKPWHYAVFQQNMKDWIWEKNKKRVSLLSFGMRKQDEKRCRNEFGMRITESPFCGDPLRMTHDEAKAVANLL